MTDADRLTTTEVERRVPTLALIRDETIRTATTELTAQAPEYFWNKPASESGYHHPLTNEHRGLWLHTLWLGTAIERLAASYVQGDRHDLRWHDVDCARAAAILHDQRKHGDPDAPEYYSVDDHELQMAAVVRADDRLPESVADAVASHMGPWADGPEPDGPVSELVHVADMMASSATITLGVHEPVPEEFEDGVEGVDLS